jgi:hypothetical protein
MEIGDLKMGGIYHYYNKCPLRNAHPSTILTYDFIFSPKSISIFKTANEYMMTFILLESHCTHKHAIEYIRNGTFGGGISDDHTISEITGDALIIYKQMVKLEKYT